MAVVLDSLSVEIPGPAGSLEGVVDMAGATPGFLAVICHPHPRHRGTMENKVVTTLARASARLGAASVRFNYRGVGRSAGSYAGGDGELEDAIAAIEWARDRYGRDLALVVAGFSFGGAIAYRAAAAVGPRALVTVAPAIARIPAAVAEPVCPWLLVQGEEDDVIAARGVLDWAGRHVRPPRLTLMAGAGHFFHGKLVELANAVSGFVGAAEVAAA